MDIFINVINQKLKIATNLKNYISGTQRFIRFVFNLGSEWDGLRVVAQFKQGNTAYNIYLDKNNTAYLPSEIKAGTCTLTLYGSNDATIGTTNYLTFTIDENNFVSNAQSTEISTSLYNQLVTKVNEIENLCSSAVIDITGGTSGLTVFYANGSTKPLTISSGSSSSGGSGDGVGISSIQYKQTDSNGGNVYTVILTNGSTYEITAPRGAKGDTGADGSDGYTPVRGKDYWTASDIAEIKSYVDDAILGGAW